MNQNIDYILIGKIVNTHGIKGEVKVISETDFKSDRYHKNNLTYIDYNGEKIFVKISGYRSHKGFDLLTFEGINDINLVEKYKGFSLYSENKKPKDLKKNEFHEADLIGLEVYQNNTFVGVIESIKTYPQYDYLEIKTTNEDLKLVPFIKEFVLDVDISNKKVAIIEMEGLI